MFLLFDNAYVHFEVSYTFHFQDINLVTIYIFIV